MTLKFTICWLTLILSLSSQKLFVYIEKRTMTEQSDKCIFCKICSGNGNTEIYYQDDTVIVFPDIKPAAKHHYLVIPHQHILNARVLTKDHKPLLEKLVEVGKQVLAERGADLTDVLFGFHWPPFNSIHHLHLHVISPASSMNFKFRLIFRKNSWWFVSPDYLLSHL